MQALLTYQLLHALVHQTFIMLNMQSHHISHVFYLKSYLHFQKTSYNLFHGKLLENN